MKKKIRILHTMKILIKITLSLQVFKNTINTSSYPNTDSYLLYSLIGYSFTFLCPNERKAFADMVEN